MQFSLTGFGFLLGYIVLVGVASFLQKSSMKQLNPYQINFLMAIGMLVTAVPALWLKQGSLSVPRESLPLGAPIGLMMALGSISYVLALSKLPVGTAAAISTSYVVLVVLLSRIFLDESLSWMKIVGISLTNIEASVCFQLRSNGLTKPKSSRNFSEMKTRKWIYRMRDRLDYGAAI